jgi:hypothetical protein
MRLRAPSFLAYAYILGMTVASADSLADITLDRCVDANANSQPLRRDGKFSEARQQLTICIDPHCPRIVRDDCTQRLDELEKAQPSFVFEAKDAAGGDLIDVRVSVDGQLLAEHLRGTLLKVDPGAHAFLFEVAGHPAVTRRLLVREGEVGRHESVLIDIGAPPSMQQTTAIGAAPPASSSKTTLPESPPPARSLGLGGQEIWGLVVAGSGVVGLGVGTVFGLMADSAWSGAKRACGGSVTQCTDIQSGNSYRSTTETDGTIATVGFIVGGALVTSGLVLFFAGARHESSPGAKVSVAPSVGPGEAGLSATASF